MSDLNTLWTNVQIMVQTTDFKVLITQKLDNSWYRGRILSVCPLGYVACTEVLLPGTDAIWELL